MATNVTLFPAISKAKAANDSTEDSAEFKNPQHITTAELLRALIKAAESTHAAYAAEITAKAGKNPTISSILHARNDELLSNVRTVLASSDTPLFDTASIIDKMVGDDFYDPARDADSQFSSKWGKNWIDNITAAIAKCAQNQQQQSLPSSVINLANRREAAANEIFLDDTYASEELLAEFRGLLGYITHTPKVIASCDDILCKGYGYEVLTALEAQANVDGVNLDTLTEDEHGNLIENIEGVLMEYMQHQFFDRVNPDRIQSGQEPLAFATDKEDEEEIPCSLHSVALVATAHDMAKKCVPTNLRTTEMGDKKREQYELRFLHKLADSGCWNCMSAEDYQLALDCLKGEFAAIKQPSRSRQ